MKRLFFGIFLIFSLIVLLTLPMAAQQSQGKEIELKTLGRAPLAPYLQTVDEVRSVLKKNTEAVGRALDYFPGGSLAEAVFARLYEDVDKLNIQRQYAPVGQHMFWMLYSKGRLLKNVRWSGNVPIDAFVFELEAEGKLFQFMVPVRCGNVALIGMKEIPVSAAPVVQPEPQPQQPEQKIEQPIIAPPAAVQSPVPVKATKRWSPTVKFKIGSGWAKTTAPPAQHLESRLDFFSLIPEEMNLFYCEEGTAAWLYTPTKDIPLVLGEQIGLHTQLQSMSSKKYQPFFVGLELEIAKNLFLTGDYFHVGKFQLQEYSLVDLMTIAELRLLGDYSTSDHSQEIACCNPTYVYYVGLERQRREQLVQRNVRVEEWSVGLKYEIKLARKFYFAPSAGVTWQEQSGMREVTEAVTKMYPFKEQSLEPQEVVSTVEKVKNSTAHPYVGASIEFYFFQVEARYLFKEFTDAFKTSPWRLQGSLVLRF